MTDRIYYRHPDNNDEVCGPFDSLDEVYDDLKANRWPINTAEIIENPYEEDEFDLIQERDGLALDYDSAMYLAYAVYQIEDIANLADWFSRAEEAYVGEYRNDEDFAEELADSLGVGSSGEWPYSHIDWQAAADELLNGDYFTENGFYFRNN